MLPLPGSPPGRGRLLARPAIVVLLVLLSLLGRPAFAQGRRILFLHHSCGQNLIEYGNVREGLAALGHQFYDHGYNADGLRLADGSASGTHFDVPDDNTDPDGLAAIFAQPLHDPPDNTFSHLMQYDVIMFKSCFPVSNIVDDAQLAGYKAHYLSIRQRIDQYPGKVFILVTQPPQVPGSSNPAEASRARALANWLKSAEYTSGHPNLFVFDFFGLLAGNDHFLRPEYRVSNDDAHPNQRANATIGPLFVAFIDQTIRTAAGQPRPTPATPTPTPQRTAQPTSTATSAARPTSTATRGQPTPRPTAVPAGGTIDGFESPELLWTASFEQGSTLECTSDAEAPHGGSASLRIRYGLASGGSGECSRRFNLPQDWHHGTGIAMWLRSDQPDQWVTLILFLGDPNRPTTFEAYFQAPEEWKWLAFDWADFGPASSASAPAVDPTAIVGLGFTFAAAGGRSSGTLWVDDISLAVETPPTPTATPLPPTPTPVPPTPTPVPPTPVPTATVARATAPMPSTSTPAVRPDTATPLPTAAPIHTPAVAEHPRRLCPLSTIALPLGAALAFLARKQQKGR